MEKAICVSIQVAGYANEQQLTRILKGILEQETEYEYEINLIDNGTVSNLEEYLESISFNKIPCNIIPKSADFFGTKYAKGKYVAFCCYGDYWTSPYKLQKQLRILEQDSQYISCVHDFDLLNLKEVSYRYAKQRIYKKARFSSDKVYTWKKLQENILPGIISSVVCRNIFEKQHIQDWLNEEKGSAVRRLFTVLALEGDCYNIYNEILAAKHCKSPYESVWPRCDFQEASDHLNELDAVCQLASENYNIDFDRSYRLIQVASLNFEYYKKSGKNADALKFFMELYEKAYMERYDAPVEECHDFSKEKAFFDFLRNKVYWYQLKSGTEEELVLMNHLNIINDDVRIERILQCYRYSSKANKVLRERLIQEAKDSESIKRTVHARLLSAPFRKVNKKVSSFGKRVHRKFKKIVTLKLRREGYSAYMANEWYDSVRVNLLTDKTTPLKDKLWCYRRGFMPWRLFQYGITEENYREYLSDRDYMYLHQINNNYKKWIEDKMTFRYVLEPFKEYLPQYYFQIIRREGCSLIVPLMDCPEGYEATFDDLFRLLRDRGALALKAASGTHGIGFYKMAYEDGKYYMNNEESSEYEITQIIQNFKSFYVVTDYINMHDEIKRLYAGSVNTLRVMMINRDGYNPQLLDAYMRIGSSTTGTTDNVAFGGVFCKIDVTTGEYSNAEQSKEHVLVSCPNHPDTNALIEGVIPHWDMIKEKLIEISKYMCQLEYLGFDVVCTPDAFVVLEINSHQDLHRYLYYDNRIKQFYFDKLELKHKIYKK